MRLSQDSQQTAVFTSQIQSSGARANDMNRTEANAPCVVRKRYIFYRTATVVTTLLTSQTNTQIFPDTVVPTMTEQTVCTVNRCATNCNRDQTVQAAQSANSIANSLSPPSNPGTTKPRPPRHGVDADRIAFPKKCGANYWYTVFLYLQTSSRSAMPNAQSILHTQPSTFAGCSPSWQRNQCNLTSLGFRERNHEG